MFLISLALRNQKRNLPSPKESTERNVFDLGPDPNTWVQADAPSTWEQLKKAPGLLSREAGAELQSLPSSTAEIYRFVASKLQGLGEEQAEKAGREITPQERELTNKFVNAFPDFMAKLSEKFPKAFPTREQSRKEISKAFKEQGQELPEKPRGAIERAAVGVGRTVPSLLLPGSAAVKATIAGTAGLTEALDLSEGQKLGANLTLPALVSIIESVARKKYIPPRGEAETLYKRGKELGLSDKELAPIMATPGQVERHGSLAQGVPKTRQAFVETQDALGNVLDNLKTRPSASVQLPIAAQNRLINELTDIGDSITKRSHSLAPKEQALVEFLQKAITDIQNNGSTPAQNVGTWRSVNKMGAGKSELNRIKKPLLEAIESVDPQIARDLEASNALYGRFVNNLKEISPSDYNAFLDAGKMQDFMASVATGNVESLSKGIGKMLGLNSLRKLSSLIITDPKAQSFVRNLGKSYPRWQTSVCQGRWIAV